MSRTSLPIIDETRDRVAEILEQVAKEGLDHPRNLDAAIDAISEAFVGRPLQRVTDLSDGAEYWLGTDEDPDDTIGGSHEVVRGVFIEDSE